MSFLPSIPGLGSVENAIGGAAGAILGSIGGGNLPDSISGTFGDIPLGNAGGLGGGMPGISSSIGFPGAFGSPSSVLKNNPYATPQYMFPLNLGSEGNEPYVIFDIRDSVAVNAASKGTIALYLPNDLQTTYSAAYEDGSMGILGMDLTRGASADVAKDIYHGDASGVIDKLKEQFSETTSKKIWDSTKSGLGSAAQATAINADARAQRVVGQIVNPHLAVLFKGVPFRTFSMAWDFVARNIQESNMIRDIIYNFKYRMHPALPAGDVYERFMLYPENFVIGFFSPTSEYLFKISPAALTSMTVNYNGSGVPAFFENTGAPVNIKLQLNFTETEIMTKERIITGN